MSQQQQPWSFLMSNFPLEPVSAISLRTQIISHLESHTIWTYRYTLWLTKDFAWIKILFLSLIKLLCSKCFKQMLWNNVMPNIPTQTERQLSLKKNEVLTATMLWLEPHGTPGCRVLPFPPVLTWNVSSWAPPPPTPSPLWFRTHYKKLVWFYLFPKDKEQHKMIVRDSRGNWFIFNPWVIKTPCSNKDPPHYQPWSV